MTNDSVAAPSSVALFGCDHTDYGQVHTQRLHDGMTVCSISVAAPSKASATPTTIHRFLFAELMDYCSLAATGARRATPSRVPTHISFPSPTEIAYTWLPGRPSVES